MPFTDIVLRTTLSEWISLVPQTTKQFFKYLFHTCTVFLTIRNHFHKWPNLKCDSALELVCKSIWVNVFLSVCFRYSNPQMVVAHLLCRQKSCPWCHMLGNYQKASGYVEVVSSTSRSASGWDELLQKLLTTLQGANRRAHGSMANSGEAEPAAIPQTRILNWLKWYTSVLSMN